MDTKTCYNCHKDDVPYRAKICPHCQSKYVGRLLGWVFKPVNSENIARREAGLVLGKWVSGATIAVFILAAVTGAVAYFNPDFRAWLMATAKDILQRQG